MDGKIDWNDIVTSKRIAYSNPSYASCRAGEKIGFTYGVVINDPLRTQRVNTSPIEFLGRVILASLSDSNEVRSFSESVCKSLRAIDKCHLTGVQKIWILHHLLIPRARWPLLIYEVPQSR